MRDLLGCDLDEAREAIANGDYNIPYLEVALEVQQIERRHAAMPEWVSFPGGSVPWPCLAERYFQKRGITTWTRERWGLGVALKGELAGRIWIPIRNEDGELVSWQARTYVGDSIRYMSPDKGKPVPTLFGAEHWPEREDRRVLVVVEGPFDALAVDQATLLPVAAIIGSEPNARQMSQIATFPEVVAFTDADPAGDKAAQYLAGIGRWTTVHRVRLPDGCDPGGMTADVLREVLMPWRDIGDPRRQP